MDVYLDSAPENLTPELTLNAEHVLDDRWNTWLRPLATARAFADFLDRWRRNDPDGIWGFVTEQDGSLLYVDSDSDEPEEFPQVARAGTGEALYDLTGWVWVLSP